MMSSTQGWIIVGFLAWREATRWLAAFVKARYTSNFSPAATPQMTVTAETKDLDVQALTREFEKRRRRGVIA